MLAEENPIKGIFICLLSYFFISLIGLCEKPISTSISIPIIIFFQNIICLILLIPSVIRNDISLFKTNYIGTYLIRIGSGLGCYAALFYIIRFIPISEALLYQYSASLWIPFITLFWFKTQMPTNLWWGIIVGFIGITLILNPTSSMIGIISILGILCGILQAISVVAVRKLSINEPILRVLFYYFLISALVMSPFVIRDWVHIGLHDFALILGVGISTYLAQHFFAISLKYAQPTTLAPICYVSIFYSGILSWIFWKELPEINVLAGMSLVILGCILTIFITQKNHKLKTLAISSPNIANVSIK